jgi:hypothetical protein
MDEKLTAEDIARMKREARKAAIGPYVILMSNKARVDLQESINERFSREIQSGDRS